MWSIIPVVPHTVERSLEHSAGIGSTVGAAALPAAAVPAPAADGPGAAGIERVRCHAVSCI
jgi:hypothetical protein